MLKYIISGIAAINTQVVVLLALRKVGFELSPLNSPLEFVGGCLIGMVLCLAYSLAIEHAAQQSVHPTKGGQS